jgi:outer membrane protein assembly factor BamD (BamD/ComL family)
MYGAMSGQFGNIEKSIKHLNVAVFSAPHYETAYTNLTTAYMQTNDTVNARKTIENYIRLNGTTQRLDGMLKAIDKVEGK